MFRANTHELVSDQSWPSSTPQNYSNYSNGNHNSSTATSTVILRSRGVFPASSLYQDTVFDDCSTPPSDLSDRYVNDSSSDDDQPLIKQQRRQRHAISSTPSNPSDATSAHDHRGLFAGVESPQQEKTLEMTFGSIELTSDPEQWSVQDVCNHFWNTEFRHLAMTKFDEEVNIYFYYNKI